jgi:hypothetical protein
MMLINVNINYLLLQHFNLSRLFLQQVLHPSSLPCYLTQEINCPTLYSRKCRYYLLERIIELSFLLSLPQIVSRSNPFSLINHCYKIFSCDGGFLAYPIKPQYQTSTHYLDLTDLDHKIEAKDSDDEMERVAQKTRESIALRMEVALKAPVF